MIQVIAVQLDERSAAVDVIDTDAPIGDRPMMRFLISSAEYQNLTQAGMPTEVV